MKVKVKLFASLRKLGPDEQIMELPEQATIAQVIELLRIPNISLLRIVNGEHRPPDYILKEGDELAIFPPIAGGAQVVSGIQKGRRHRKKDFRAV